MRLNALNSMLQNSRHDENAFFRLEKERVKLFQDVKIVLEKKANPYQEQEHSSHNFKEQMYSGVVISKLPHLLEVKIETGIIVSVPRKWVKLGFAGYNFIKRGDKVTVKNLGFDKILRKEILLVVPTQENLSMGTFSVNFSYLLGRDTWKEEK